MTEFTSPKHSISVVIPAFTMERWNLLQEAVRSVGGQTYAADATIVCIDNNPALLARAQAEWGDDPLSRVHVIPNETDAHLAERATHVAAHGTSRRFGAGSARNTAVAHVASDVIAFLDDDARAEPDWLEHLASTYEDSSVVAVGGPPLPDYESSRPIWFPVNFDWVFGCAYDGLPTSVAPLRRLIGANMSVRRTALEAIGGFYGNDFDDLNVCERLRSRFGPDAIVYNPAAVVHHYVPDRRTSWAYFCRRCYFVNREKVRVFAQIGTRDNLQAERAFVWRTIRHRMIADARRGIRGERGAFLALGATLVGLSLAGAGHARGQLMRATRGRSSDLDQ